MTYYERYKDERLAYQTAYNLLHKEKYVNYQHEYYKRVVKPNKHISVCSSKKIKCNPDEKAIVLLYERTQYVREYELPENYFKVEFK